MDFTRNARTVEDIESDLMFGELPDDDDDLSYYGQDEFDINNDETFGAELDDVEVDAELEDYAAQTAKLRLDDDSVWSNNATSSAAAAPDASQIPMPSFFDSNMFAPQLNMFGGDLGRSVWGSNDASSTSFNIWGAPGEVVPQASVRYADFDTPSDLKKFFDESSSKQQPQPATTPRIPVMPISALTLDDLERQHFVPSPEPFPSEVTQQQQNQVAVEKQREEVVPQADFPAMPTTCLTIDELEKKLIKEAQISVKEDQQTPLHARVDVAPSPRRTDSRPQSTHPPQQMQHQRMPPPPFHGMPPFPPFPMPGPGRRFPPFAPLPPLPPGAFPPIPPFPQQFLHMLPMWLSYLAGMVPMLPPNVPPPPPYLSHLLSIFKEPRAVFSAIMQATLGGNPQKMSEMEYFEAQRAQNVQRTMAQQHSHFRKPGMPSGRTIQDLAFDAFAGYMSWKEREYLVKIQIFQCQGCGDPLVEDYYYTIWREKKIAAGWTPQNKPAAEKDNGNETRTDYLERVRRLNYREQQLRRQREREKERAEAREKKTKPERKPLAVIFAGSLGLPSKSTTANPRHLIEVRSKNSETKTALSQMTDDERRQAAQKRLRTMLMRLEEAIALLIEIEELKTQTRKVSRFTELTSDERLAEIRKRMDVVIDELIMGDELYKLLQMGKGRSVVRRVLAAANSKDQARVILALVSASVLVNKKMFDEASSDISPHFYSTLMTFSDRQLEVVFSALKYEIIEKALNDRNLLICDHLLTMLFVFYQKKMVLDRYLGDWVQHGFRELLRLCIVEKDSTGSGTNNHFLKWRSFLRKVVPNDDTQRFCMWISDFLGADISSPMIPA